MSDYVDRWFDAHTEMLRDNKFKVEEVLEVALKEAILEHVQKQPYSAECAEYGEPLKLDAKIDYDMDLAVQVKPCRECVAKGWTES